MLELVAVREGWWSSIIEHADVVSEGEPVTEADGRAYYGSTSVHCVIDDALDDVEEIAAVVLSDPHARLKLLRLAHREAVVRAGAPLNVLYAELSAKLIVDDEKPTLTIAIDVSARLAQVPGNV